MSCSRQPKLTRTLSSLNVSHAPFLSVVLCRGCGWFLHQFLQCKHKWFSVPLRGVDCFYGWNFDVYEVYGVFPSPCGVWVVSMQHHASQANTSQVSVPLRGVGCFTKATTTCRSEGCFRPLAGCGLFRQSCTFFLVQQEKELSTLLFYCIILADGLSIAN